jgi:hypothetical protein
MDKKLIEKIKDIVEDHLCNTEINKIELCEDTHDHYLLGKWDLAEIEKENKLLPCNNCDGDYFYNLNGVPINQK